MEKQFQTTSFQWQWKAQDFKGWFSLICLELLVWVSLFYYQTKGHDDPITKLDPRAQLSGAIDHLHPKLKGSINLW